MSTDALIEQRLSAVEAAVVELQRRVVGGPPAANWIERFTGSFKNEPAFAQVVEYGRALRSADRPREGDG
jgi:hypothetical protein